MENGCNVFIFHNATISVRNSGMLFFICEHHQLHDIRGTHKAHECDSARSKDIDALDEGTLKSVRFKVYDTEKV